MVETARRLPGQPLDLTQGGRSRAGAASPDRVDGAASGRRLGKLAVAAVAAWGAADALVALSPPGLSAWERAVVAGVVGASQAVVALGAGAAIARYPWRRGASCAGIGPVRRMTVARFQRKWRLAKRIKERSGYVEHFIDLCHLFGVQTPIEADPTGDEFFAFEKGATKSTGGKGWADVWRRGYYAWEYKGFHADLDEAYLQLQRYLDHLENPPLLVVCDFDHFVIRTHFTNTPTEVYRFDLEGLSDPDNLRVLRAAFTDPEQLRPRGTAADACPRISAGGR
ncbi:MAG TPA: type IIL restriction-modification enzyme MmeI [Thermomicrobiales bacterium]|jgi:hypothetical protein